MIMTEITRPEIRKLETEAKKKQLVSIEIQVDCETGK